MQTQYLIIKRENRQLKFSFANSKRSHMVCQISAKDGTDSSIGLTQRDCVILASYLRDMLPKFRQEGQEP